MPVQSEEMTNQSQVVPALMLVAMLAVTGLEAVLVFAAPQRVVAHPVAGMHHPIVK